MGSHAGNCAHVVAVPFFWPGHIAPLLHLCRHLVSSSCTVTLLKVAQDDANIVQWDHGVKILSVLPLPPPKVLPAARTKDQNKHLEVIVGYFKQFQSLADAVKPMVEELSKDGPPVTCIISDVYVGWARELAKELNIPWIAFWTSTVAELVIYYHMPRLIAENVFPFALGPPSQELITCIPGLPKLHPTDYPTFGLIPDMPPLYTILHTFKDLVQRIPEANMVLVNSVYEVETAPIDSLRKNSNINVHSVGPLHMLSSGSITNANLVSEVEEESIIQWLDTKPKGSVLYIAFGTTMPMAPGQFQELAFALEESGQTFVWAIRQSVATVLPDGFQERITSSNQGFILPWAPQLAILKHSSVGGFFTHCGWNSVLESISLGMPMIARPISGDQALTRRFLVEEWRVALGFQGGNKVADRAELKRAMKALMEGPEGVGLRKRAIEMKKLVQKAMSDNGSSWTSLDLLVYNLHEKAKETKKRLS